MKSTQVFFFYTNLLINKQRAIFLILFPPTTDNSSISGSLHLVSHLLHEVHKHNLKACPVELWPITPLLQRQEMGLEGWEHVSDSRSVSVSPTVTFFLLSWEMLYPCLFSVLVLIYSFLGC